MHFLLHLAPVLPAIGFGLAWAIARSFFRD